MYEYTDVYLSKRINAEIETRAEKDIANFGTFPSDWVERLVTLRAYIIACQENTTSIEDTFSAKLKVYEKEFQFGLQNAKKAQADTISDSSLKPSFMTIGLERN